MIKFHFSTIFLVLALHGTAYAQALDLSPRTPLEAILLGEAEAAKAHLEALADQGIADRDEVVAELIAAGFEPDRGYPGCAYYSYYRRTTEAGAARSAEVAFCRNGKTMVLVLDMLPPDRRGGGSSTVRERKIQ